MAGFDVVTERNPVTPFDVESARYLMKNMKELKIVRNNPQTPSWARHFRLLRLVDQVSPERIKEVLDWYVAHAKDEYTPMAHTAELFRRKFQAIEKAMKRAAPKQEELRPEVVALLKLIGLHWPENTDPNEAGPCLQKSIDNYKDFRARLKHAKANPPMLSGFKKMCWPNLMEELYLRTRGSEVELMEAWLREVHAIAWRWPEWGGHLAKWAWRPTVRRYAKVAAMWVMEFCGHVFTWDEIVKELYGTHDGG